MKGLFILILIKKIGFRLAIYLIILHTRGNTGDLNVVDLNTVKEVDIGSSFDFFGKISHHRTLIITKEQAKIRKILKIAMGKSGFEYYQKMVGLYS